MRHSFLQNEAGNPEPINLIQKDPSAHRTWNKHIDVYKRFSQSTVRPIFPISYYFTTCQCTFTIILILTVSVHVLIIWTGIFSLSSFTSVYRIDSQIVEWVSNPYHIYYGNGSLFGVPNGSSFGVPNGSSVGIPTTSGAFIWSFYIIFAHGLVIIFWLSSALMYVIQYFRRYCVCTSFLHVRGADITSFSILKEKEGMENSASFDYCLSFGVRSTILEDCTAPETSHQICNQHYQLTSTNQYYLREVDRYFTFNNHARRAFYSLRKIFKYSDRHCVESLAMGQIISLGKGSGKSGADFYTSHDGKVMLKALRGQEWRTLMTILPAYIEYCRQNPHTFLPRFYGCVTIEINQPGSFGVRKSIIGEKKQNLRNQSTKSKLKNESEQLKPGIRNQFVIMNNVFTPGVQIDRKFDLKGSLQGRIAKKGETDGLLKDQDLISLTQYDEVVDIGSKKKIFLREQLRRDTAFLRDQGTMDYSLLLGLHRINKMESLCCRCSPFQKSNEASTPAIRGKGEHVYFMGIIDVLQTYNVKKKVENAVKGIPYKRSEISCVNPIQYSKRFIDFLENHVLKK